MELRSTDPSLSLTAAITPRPNAGSVSHSTTSQAGGESDGKQSSGETSRMKKKQSDRLTIVKKRTLAVVIVADIILLIALAYQIIWLNESLHAALEDKLIDLTGFYKSRYQEKMQHLSMGSQLYTRNASTSIACLCLQGNTNAQSELQLRLGNDLQSRGLEIGIVTDRNGIVRGTGGRLSGLGTLFNPQNLVTEFDRLYGASSTDQLMASVMIPREIFLALKSHQNAVTGDVRLDLRTWINYTESLTRVVLAPLACGTSRAQGYLVWGDAWYPRQYDAMNRLSRSTKSSLVALFARSSSSAGGAWQMPYSYNHGGSTGWADTFPDLLPYLAADDLVQYASSATVSTGLAEFGGIKYMFGARRIPKQYLGGIRISGLPEPQGLILYAEPIAPITHVVTYALLWHVPFGIFMSILSFVSLHHTFRKFLNPMRLLIDSVKKKKLAEFNERIRQMKQSRATLATLLLKTIVVQGALLGLIFVNRTLLASAIQDFTSATTKGRIGPYLAASQSRSVAKTLNGWTGFANVINASVSGVATPALRSDFNARAQIFDADAIYLLTKNSIVLASTYSPCEGLVFPEIGLLEYYNRLQNADMDSFLTLTSWHPSNVNLFTDQNYTLSEPPALIRLAVAPVNYISFDVSADEFIMGDLVGALVVVRILNGYRPIWQAISDSFDYGYYGIYQWDRLHMRFTGVTSILKSTETDYDVDVSESNPDLLRNGIMTSFEDDSVYVRDSVAIQDRSNTVSVAPYFSTIDDVILSPMMMNAYLVTGVLQDRYDAMLARQLVLQSSIMVVEFLTSMIALACTYWPLKKFLNSLEKAFNVPSLSLDKRQKMEERASAMLDRTRPETMPSPRPLHSDRITGSSRVSNSRRSQATLE